MMAYKCSSRLHCCSKNPTCDHILFCIQHDITIAATLLHATATAISLYESPDTSQLCQRQYMCIQPAAISLYESPDTSQLCQLVTALDPGNPDLLAPLKCNQLLRHVNAVVLTALQPAMAAH